MWGAINDRLAAGLEVLALRQRLLAQNVANADTPGYKRYDVDFARALEERLGPPATGAGTGGAPAGGPAGAPATAPGGRLALAITHPRHLSGRAGTGDPARAVYRETVTALRNDGNNVDLDAEMARLAETGLYYQALVRQLSDRIALLRTVIAEGRR
ncbi:flagellar basal-body rod protein FlgB [Thermaerobacter marianensis DSM 12885]|uniref:Flagellar basal body rod protein FlgB n=1 Tax=Thermaerobacter marianensis (strain ATCC 700841 / DSM 12885 / JCM 10246 / 7p75a) TaxID=644966 RepID=E6SJM5_THEM7|nr:flagellar basal body protein [Thermaerobacter marianensis]ADU51088.1 flagellar basal-body rod protein FlgB [Thermaerobacter marianensis DSM 12885]